MLLLVAPFFLLLGARAAPVESCTTFPNWTIAKFKSESTDTVGAGGSASLSLTNSLTGKTDEVTCKLQVNYRCIVVGTASDKNLTVNIAIRAGFVTLVLDQEVHDCPGRTTPLHVIGRDDVELECKWNEGDVVGGAITCTQALEEDVLEGGAVELAPE